MSLSQEPAFSTLKNHFVCGTRDISDQPYSGVSGRHLPTGNAIHTTNGAGPHNLQLFILSADGVVLTCLPGYWNSSDLVREMQFAYELNKVWQDPSLTRSQKDALFREGHLSHISEHPMQMVARSRMQGFDQKYEAKRRLHSSDCIADPSLITDPYAQRLPQEAFKTTDEIMHARMAQRPFVPYQQFDVAVYTDYGRPLYDKNEDLRSANGELLPGADPRQKQLIGNTSQMKRNRHQNRNWNGVQYYGRRFGNSMLRYGVGAATQ